MAEPESFSIHALGRHFPVRIRPATRLTDDELFELCVRNRRLRIEQTRDGEIIVMSPTGAETGRRNFQLIVALGTWAARDGTGVGFDSNAAGFILPSGAERAPDAAWIRRERWAALTRDQQRKFAPLCPDFVVELCSPSNSLAELEAKMEEYIECGARLAWLVDLDGRQAWIYRPGRPVETIHDGATSRGSPSCRGSCWICRRSCSRARRPPRPASTRAVASLPVDRRACPFHRTTQRSNRLRFRFDRSPSSSNRPALSLHRIARRSTSLFSIDARQAVPFDRATPWFYRATPWFYRATPRWNERAVRAARSTTRATLSLRPSLRVDDRSNRRSARSNRSTPR
jgi:Uma2 family endonuclease